MTDARLDEFKSEDESAQSPARNGAKQPDNENLPERFKDSPIPPVEKREPIAPETDACPMRTGDMLVIRVGTEELGWYGFVPLNVYGGSVIGYCPHSRAYTSRERDRWVEWFETHDFVDETSAEGDKAVYKDVAPSI